MNPKNPFDLPTVLLFGARLAVVILLSTALTETFGQSGGILFAAVAGVSDVDAVTLSMTQIAGGALSADAAAVAILVAVASYSLSKTVLGPLPAASASAWSTAPSASLRSPRAETQHRPSLKPRKRP